jgi:hypothetical protein
MFRSRFALACVVVAALVRVASAQVHPLDTKPYDQNPACRFVPFIIDRQGNMVDREPHVPCSQPTSSGIVRMDPTVYSFAEGAVHLPGSELAWVVLANFRTVPITVVVETLLSGGGFWYQEVDIKPLERHSLELHSHPSMQFATTFSVRVFWPGDGDAQLVLRPAVDTFSKVTLPPATVTKLTATP